jgi:hypothetical protein
MRRRKKIGKDLPALIISVEIELLLSATAIGRPQKQGTLYNTAENTGEHQYWAECGKPFHRTVGKVSPNLRRRFRTGPIQDR